MPLLLVGAVLGLLLHPLPGVAGFVSSTTCLPLRTLLWPGAAVGIAALLARSVVVVTRVSL